jgi:hypothetical protein
MAVQGWCLLLKAFVHCALIICKGMHVKWVGMHVVCCSMYSRIGCKQYELLQDRSRQQVVVC